MFDNLAAKKLSVAGGVAEEPVGGAACEDCRHRSCQVCEENSAAKQHSDFWICHRCGELNRRAQG